MSAPTAPTSLGTPASVDPLAGKKMEEVKLPASLNGLNELPKTWKGDTSTSVRLFEDSNGNRFIAKQSRNGRLSQEQLNTHTKTEFQAGCALRAMGVPVPATALIKDENGNPLIIQKYVEARPLHQVLTGDYVKDKPILNQITPHFYTFAMMGGWDVAGLCWNNILVDNAGKVVFVDYGLMFGHMHNGFEKSGLPFKVAAPDHPHFQVEQQDYWSKSDGAVIDLFYLRNYADRLSAAHIFDSLTDEDIRA
ncbi:MAG: hypothetical protein KR126chlam3_00798, partial [Chlamydiae bacterium]|nr:hypothetical protein [Chlamydiota bacterium]